MIVKKQYIPKRYRSKKLVNAGGGMVVGGSSASGSSVDTSSFLLADKFTSLFEYDEVNDAIKAKLPFYSEGEISAYGYGGSGGGGGTGIVYNGLDSTITDIALSAYMGNVLNTNKLEVSTFNSWVSNYAPPAPAWGDVTGKPATFTPSAHVHGWGEIENKPTTFAPSAHTHTWDSIESKPNVITGTTASFTTELETKLSGIESGANNYTHPATHAPSIIAQDADNRFFTDTERTKLSGIATGAEVNVQSDWNAASGDAYILNKPTALPASDVYAWAKAPTKPSYIASEIGGLGASYRWLTDTYISTWNAKANGTHTHNLSEIGITGLTANYLTKFNGSTLVNSQIFDNGTNVGISTATPSKPLTIQNDSATIRLQASTNPSGYFTHITGRYDAVNPFDISINNYGVVLAVGEPSGYSGVSITYMNGYYGSALLGRDKFGVFVDPDGNVGVGTTDPTVALDVNGTGKFKDDILMTFKTTAWSYDTSKSLKLFLDKFDIDTSGNLVVKTNLYSMGEVTAYSSGTGVSGLKLMGNLDANNKNINNVLNINAQQVNTSKILAGALQIGNNPIEDFPNCVGLFGYRDDEVATYLNLIAAYKENTGEYIYANNLFVVDSAGQAAATSFKFGNWTFKQDASGRLGIYNGTTEVACFNTDGTYVNL